MVDQSNMFLRMPDIRLVANSREGTEQVIKLFP